MDLREYLFRNRMKGTEFAKKIGYNARYINSIVRGDFPAGPRLAETISKATDHAVTVEEIVAKKAQVEHVAEKAQVKCRREKKSNVPEQFTFAEMSE